MSNSITASHNGYTTTLNVCREHIDDACAMLNSVHGMLNSFAEQYIDVNAETFARRAAVSQGQYARAFNTAMESLYDTVQLLSTAKALAVGADLIATNAISSTSDDE